MADIVLSWPRNSKYPAFVIPDSFQNLPSANNDVIWFAGYIANRGSNYLSDTGYAVNPQMMKYFKSYTSGSV